MNNTGSSTMQIMDLLILSFQEGRLEARRVCIIRRNFPHSCRHEVLSMVLKHNSGWTTLFPTLGSRRWLCNLSQRFRRERKWVEEMNGDTQRWRQRENKIGRDWWWDEADKSREMRMEGKTLVLTNLFFLARKRNKLKTDQASWFWISCPKCSGHLCIKLAIPKRNLQNWFAPKSSQSQTSDTS